MTAQTDYTDFAQRAYAPISALSEMFIGNVERLANFQYRLAGDCMSLALEQMRATAQARDLTTLVAQQREIASKFAEKSQQHQQSLSKLAADAQAGFATWIEASTAAVSSKTA
jgi:phasin family protein